MGTEYWTTSAFKINVLLNFRLPYKLEYKLAIILVKGIIFSQYIVQNHYFLSKIDMYSQTCINSTSRQQPPVNNNSPDLQPTKLNSDF
jgi:hypothetical protein